MAVNAAWRRHITDLLTDRIGWIIFFAALIVGLVVRFWVILHGVEDGDVQHFHGIGIYFLQGRNPYRLPPFESNFPPIALYLEAAAVLVSNATGVPFHVIFKLWPLAADLGTALVIFYLLRRSGQTLRWAAIWASIFNLNPVSILITAAHGNLDSVTNCLSVLALALMVWNPARLFAWSACALGFAIGIKTNPVLLVPILACYPGLPPRKRVIYCVVCALPAVLTFIPFFIDSPSGVVANVFGYAGETDFGYAAIMRLLWFFKSGNLHLPGTVLPDLAISRLSFGAAYVALLAYGAGRLHPARLAMLTYLLYYVLISGLSAQYFVWIVPFAVLAGDWLVLGYSAWATLGLVGFYAFFFPPVLFGDLYTLPARLRTMVPLYFWSGVAMWIGNVAWLVVAIRTLVLAGPTAGHLARLSSLGRGGRFYLLGNLARAYVVAFSVSIVAVSLIPVMFVVSSLISSLLA